VMQKIDWDPTNLIQTIHVADWRFFFRFREIFFGSALNHQNLLLWLQNTTLYFAAKFQDYRRIHWKTVNQILFWPIFHAHLQISSADKIQNHWFILDMIQRDLCTPYGKESRLSDNPVANRPSNTMKFRTGVWSKSGTEIPRGSRVLPFSVFFFVFFFHFFSPCWYEVLFSKNILNDLLCFVSFVFVVFLSFQIIFWCVCLMNSITYFHSSFLLFLTSIS